MRFYLFAFISIFLLFLISCSTNSIESEVVIDDSSDVWKEGRYFYVDSLFGSFLIKREDSIQLEYLKRHQLEVQFKLNWLNDSVYTLTFDKVNQNPNAISLPHDIDSLVKTCTITASTDTSYVERATSNLNDQSILTTIYRAKKEGEKPKS